MLLPVGKDRYRFRLDNNGFVLRTCVTCPQRTFNVVNTNKSTIHKCDILDILQRFIKILIYTAPKTNLTLFVCIVIYTSFSDNIFDMQGLLYAFMTMLFHFSNFKFIKILISLYLQIINLKIDLVG